jgi:hypothetical protein
MRLRKAAAGAVAIATALTGLVTVGAGSANATTCARSNPTYFGAVVTLCGTSTGTLNWSIDTSHASTDERMWFTFQDDNAAGCHTSWNVNDFQQHSGTRSNACRGPWTVSWYSTEASQGVTGSDGLTWG